MKKLFKWLENIEEGLAGVLFIGGVVVSLYGVFTRYILNAPESWITEIFEFLLTWSIFIGFGMALKDNRHIQVELLFDKLPKSLKRIVATISNLIGAGFSLYLAYSSLELIAISNEQGTKTIDVGMPIWISYLVLPIGMGLLGIYFIVKAYKAMKGDQSELIGEIEQLYESMQNEGDDDKKGVGA